MDNSTPSVSERLVQYLDGELSGEAKQQLEELLATDSLLMDEYRRLLETRAALRHYALQQQVAGVHQQLMPELAHSLAPAPSRSNFLRYSLAVAASVMLLIGTYLLYSFFQLSPDKVFAANYTRYEIKSMRDGNAGVPGAAALAYQEKNYREVLRLHDSSAARSPELEFLAGIAAIELRNDAKAIQCFREVLDRNQQEGLQAWNDEAEYYLALGYLRNKDYDFAIPLLQKIHDDSRHSYHRQVTKALIRKVKLLKWR